MSLRSQFDRRCSHVIRGAIVSGGAAFVALIICAGVHAGGDPGLGDLRFLPGDDVPAPAVGRQFEITLVEGGPGYLALWTDARTVLSGTVNAPSQPLAGNMLDIYGQILDQDGNPLGPPVIVANLGRSQRDPSAAWNGENWLVAYETDDPDWYFDQHIFAVRVSPTGEVLDSEPLVLVVETGGQGAYDPSVTSDGENWLVVCDQWFGSPSQRTVRAVRVAPDGTILDTTPVVMQQSNSLQNPVVAFADGVYLLAANSYSDNNVYFRRFATDLTPISTLQVLGPAIQSRKTAVAAKGDRFLVVGRRAHRIEPDGTVLDPGGIPLGGSTLSTFHGAAWTGAHWIVSMRNTEGFSWNVSVQRIADNGVLLDAEPILIEPAVAMDNFESPTAVGGSGTGDALALYGRRGATHQADVYSAHIDPDGVVNSINAVSIGLPRQSYAQIVQSGGQYLAVFVSETSGSTRILSQRIAPNGNPIDAEPTVVHSIELEGGLPLLKPKVAWNGSVYLIGWQDLANGPMGVRLTSENTVIDQTPILIATDPPPGNTFTLGGIGAAGEVFVVGIIRRIAFHEPVQYSEFVRVRGSDGQVLESSPVFVAAGFARDMTGASFSDKAVFAWAQYSTHDSTTAYIQGVIVTADGTHSGSISISAIRAKWPGIATAGDQALVVWQDFSTINQDDIRGRMLMADGTFGGSHFLISGAPKQQMFPSVGFDGNQFVAAWTDYRSNTGTVDQLRGDIMAARVDVNGQVIDPNGLEITTGPLPEDLPAVAGVDGKAIIIFSILHGLGGQPEVQRLGYRTVGAGSSSTPALLLDFQVVFGFHIAGTLDDIRQSDDQYLRIGSAFGFSAQEPNIMDVRIGAQTEVPGPSSMGITIESRLNNPGGTARVRVRNWSSSQFEEVHQYPIGQTEEVIVIGNVDATDRVRGKDGRIELSIRHAVIATFSASGFESFFDWVEIAVD